MNSSKIIWVLDDHIDISPLESLHLNICRGIALSNKDLNTRLIPHYEANGLIDEAIDFKNNESARISAVREDYSNILSPAELEIYNSLNYNQKRVFF